MDDPTIAQWDRIFELALTKLLERSDIAVEKATRIAADIAFASLERRTEAFKALCGE